MGCSLPHPCKDFLGLAYTISAQKTSCPFFFAKAMPWNLPACWDQINEAFPKGAFSARLIWGHRHQQQRTVVLRPGFTLPCWRTGLIRFFSVDRLSFPPQKHVSCLSSLRRTCCWSEVKPWREDKINNNAFPQSLRAAAGPGRTAGLREPQPAVLWVWVWVLGWYGGFSLEQKPPWEGNT